MSGDPFGIHYIRAYTPFLSENRTQEEVDFMISTGNLSQQSTIVDIGCGHGRHLLEFLSRAFTNIHGFDQSSEAVAAADPRIAGRIHCGDFRSAELGTGECDAVLALFGAFGVEVESVDDDFRLVASWLKPGGWLFIDFLNHDYCLHSLHRQGWELYDDGLLLLEACDYEIGRQVLTTHRKYMQDGHLLSESSFSMRLVTPDEIRRLSASCGMIVEHLSGSMREGDHSVEGMRIHAAIQKPIPESGA